MYSFLVASISLSFLQIKKDIVSAHKYENLYVEKLISAIITAEAMGLHRVSNTGSHAMIWQFCSELPGKQSKVGRNGYHFLIKRSKIIHKER